MVVSFPHRIKQTTRRQNKIVSNNSQDVVGPCAYRKQTAGNRIESVPNQSVPTHTFRRHRTRCCCMLHGCCCSVNICGVRTDSEGYMTASFHRPSFFFLQTFPTPIYAVRSKVLSKLISLQARRQKASNGSRRVLHTASVETTWKDISYRSVVPLL